MKFEENSPLTCPRCGAGRLQDWASLTAEEQEVVKRLPGAGDYHEDERRIAHRWCTRCWFESAASDTSA
jgi:hypothetical protein